MKTERLEYRNFASVAEAVAHYYKQGFETFDSGISGERTMRMHGAGFFDEVRITHAGLLDVRASVVRLT